MSARAFVDTNVWVYAVDTADREKQRRALEILAASPEKDYVISAQVVGEFYATVTGKLSKAVTPSDGRLMVKRMQELPVLPIDMTLVNDAIAGSERWNISYWDALIIAAATSAGCPVLLSEDLAHGTSYGSVHVQNPFRVEPVSDDKSPISGG